MKIVVATRNRKKLDELSRIFKGMGVDFLSLDLFPDCPEVMEDGKTFKENALKKALHVFHCTGYPAVADDSGLEVEALGGAPGVFSARYAGEDADDENNVKKLLHEMKNLGPDARKARFVCCIAFVMNEGQYTTFTDYVNGVIGRKPVGDKGFGYDPVFYPEGYERTFAEMADSQKDSLSHRGRAIAKFHAFLKKKIDLSNS